MAILWWLDNLEHLQNSSSPCGDLQWLVVSASQRAVYGDAHPQAGQNDPCTSLKVPAVGMWASVLDHKKWKKPVLVNLEKQAGGGSVISWTMFCWKTVGPGIHLNIFADQIHPFMTTAFPKGLFRQYNVPSHTANIVLEWLEEHGKELKVVTLPPNYPDLNPI